MEAEREEGRSGVEQGREGGRERETIIEAEGNMITYHFLLVSFSCSSDGLTPCVCVCVSGGGGGGMCVYWGEPERAPH